MSENEPEQVEGTTEVEQTEDVAAPEQAEVAEPKKSALELLVEAYPVGSRVVFEKTDDKGKAGEVKGHTEKFGVPYLQVDVELASGKTRPTNPRSTSVRPETEEDVVAREKAAEEKALAKAAAEEKKKAAEEAAAQKKAEAEAAATEPAVELSDSAKQLAAEENAVSEDGGADEVEQPAKRSRRTRS